jgi:predicted dienelactone hydrolase
MSRLRRRRMTLLALVAVMGLAAAACAPGVPDGPFAVGTRSYTFVDASRVTKSHNGQPARPSRALPTQVWYPAQGAPGGRDQPNAPADKVHGPYPLVVFSHGYTGNGPVYGPVVREWVKAGYVVAAPTFPLTHGGTPGGTDVTDYVEQPRDVSFVLGEMLRLNNEPASGLRHLIDPMRIAAAGHSLGAITTIGVAYNTCCRDPRIRAAIPISGRERPFPGGKSHFVRTPSLFIHGDADGTVPYPSGHDVFLKQAQRPKFFLTLFGAGHIDLFLNASGRVINKSVIDFLDLYVKDRPSGLTRIRHDGDKAGVSSLDVRQHHASASRDTPSPDLPLLPL